MPFRLPEDVHELCPLPWEPGDWPSSLLVLDSIFFIFFLFFLPLSFDSLRYQGTHLCRIVWVEQVLLGISSCAHEQSCVYISAHGLEISNMLNSDSEDSIMTNWRWVLMWIFLGLARLPSCQPFFVAELFLIYVDLIWNLRIVLSHKASSLCRDWKIGFQRLLIPNRCQPSSCTLSYALLLPDIWTHTSLESL